MTDSEMLTKVEAAIDATLTGNASSYTIAGRSLTRLPIDQLYRMRQDLLAAVSRASNGTFQAVQFRKPE